MKDARRREQEGNIARKKHEREEHKQRSMEGIKRKLAQEAEDIGAEKPELSGQY